MRKDKKELEEKYIERAKSFSNEDLLDEVCDLCGEGDCDGYFFPEVECKLNIFLNELNRRLIENGFLKEE